MVGLDEANEDGNIQALANILFSTLRLRLRGHQRAADHRRGGRDGARPPRAAHPEADPGRRWPPQRVREYAETGLHLGPLPPPGVFARHNAVDTPALLPDGTASEASVSRVLAARGTVRSAPRDVDAVQRSIDYHPDGTPVSEASPEGRTGAVNRGPGSSSGPDLSPETPEGGA